MTLGGPQRRGWRWQEDRLGDRSLTRWPAVLAVTLVRLIRWAVGLVRGLLPEPLRARLDGAGLPWLVLSATAGLGGALVALATVATAGLYDDVEDGEGVSRLDRPVLDWVAGWRTPWLNQAVTAFTDLGSTRVMVPMMLAVAGLLWWRWRRPTPAILMAVAAAGSVLMTVVGKDLVGRVRPPLALAVPPYETSPSFPSGHTLNSWVLWILIGYLIATRLPTRRGAVIASIIAVLLATAMGMSRVYLGHHWPTDVLVAWALGTAWLTVLVTSHRLALTASHATSSNRQARRRRDADRSSAG